MATMGVVTLLGASLWVPSSPRRALKILHCLGFDDGGALHRYPLEGVVVELQLLLISFAFSGKFRFSLFFFVYLDLICKRVYSSPCINAAVVALLINRGKSLFREKRGTKWEKKTLNLEVHQIFACGG
jgi:hypothetical protein